jgi:hypothetical protein
MVGRRQYMNVEYISYLVEKLDPYTGAAIMVPALFISLFLGFSSSSRTRVFIIVLNALSYSASFYIYISTFIKYGQRNDFLVSTGMREMILSCAVLFFGLAVLLYISASIIPEGFFVRITVLLTFSLVSILLMIMAENIIFLFVMIALSVMGTFTLISSLERGNERHAYIVGKFGVRVILPVLLIFFGFSILSGTGSIKNLSGYDLIINGGDRLIIIGSIIFACAVYLYLFLYPFQGILLEMPARLNTATLSVLWFMYMPAGIIILTKFDRFFYMPDIKDNIYGFIIVALFALCSLFGAAAGAVRVLTMERLICILIIFDIGTLVLMRAMRSIESINISPAGYNDIGVLLKIGTIFIPLGIFLLILRRNNGNGLISGAGIIAQKDLFTGINLIILFLFWLISSILVFPLKRLLLSGELAETGIGGIVLFSAYYVALLLMAVNILRVIIKLFRRQPEMHGIKVKPIPRLYYACMSLFIITSLAAFILIFTGRVAIVQDQLKIWELSFNILGPGA